jgi:hypothetical protein
LVESKLAESSTKFSSFWVSHTATRTRACQAGGPRAACGSIRCLLRPTVILFSDLLKKKSMIMIVELKIWPILSSYLTINDLNFKNFSDILIITKFSLIGKLCNIFLKLWPANDDFSLFEIKCEAHDCSN